MGMAMSDQSRVMSWDSAVRSSLTDHRSLKHTGCIEPQLLYVGVKGLIDFVFNLVSSAPDLIGEPAVQTDLVIISLVHVVNASLESSGGQSVRPLKRRVAAKVNREDPAHHGGRRMI